MKKHFIHITVLLLLSCVLFNCKSDDEKLGSIIGTVTDKSTGICVPDAKMLLMPWDYWFTPNKITTTTDVEGNFYFAELTPGDYVISIKMAGYDDFLSDTITVKPWGIVISDLQIERTANPMKVVDDGGNSITELVFEKDANATDKTFYIYNASTATISYTIAKKAAWIESISQPSGTIGPGISLPIDIHINRELLENGNNETTLSISSPDSDKVKLLVKAETDIQPLKLLDEYNNEITELDFGTEDGPLYLSFDIFNGGSEDISFSITNIPEWISYISEDSGIVESGIAYTIELRIDRDLLVEGLNATTLLISSVKAGEKELVIKATKEAGGGGTNSDEWLFYGEEDNHVSCWGLLNGGADEWAVMFPSSTMSQYYGSITSVKAYLGKTGSYTVKIYKGGTDRPNTLLASQTFFVAYTGWNTVTLSPALELPGNTSLWVSISCSYSAGYHPSGATNGIGEKNARWKHNSNDVWYDAYTNNQGHDLCWEIHAYISSTAKGTEGVEVELPQHPVNADEIELLDRDEREKY